MLISQPIFKKIGSMEGWDSPLSNGNVRIDVASHKKRVIFSSLQYTMWNICCYTVLTMPICLSVSCIFISMACSSRASLSSSLISRLSIFVLSRTSSCRICSRSAVDSAAGLSRPGRFRILQYKRLYYQLILYRFRILQSKRLYQQLN